MAALLLLLLGNVVTNLNPFFLAITSGCMALVIFRGTRPRRLLPPPPYDAPSIDRSPASFGSETSALSPGQSVLAPIFQAVGGFLYDMIPDQLNDRKDDALRRLQDHGSSITLQELKDCLDRLVDDAQFLDESEKDQIREKSDRLIADPNPDLRHQRLEMGNLIIKIRGSTRIYDLLRQHGIRVPPPWCRRSRL